MSTIEEPSNNAGIRVVAAPACKLCGQEGQVLYEGLRDRLFEAPGVWSLRNCKSCQMAWLDPLPISEDVPMLYHRYYTHAPSDAKVGLGAWGFGAIAASSLGYPGPKTIGGLLEKVTPWRHNVVASLMGLRASDQGRLLDLGCGSGAFLLRMQRLGWQVLGVEPDEAAVQVAREQGLDVLPGSLEQTRLPTASQDVITLNHVVEHLPDPVSTLREAGRILRPGGRAVILTPNLISEAHQRFGAAWVHLDPPRHLHLFSPQSLQSIAEQAGFKTRSVQTLTSRPIGRFAYLASPFIAQKGSIANEVLPLRAKLWADLAWFYDAIATFANQRSQEILAVLER